MLHFCTSESIDHGGIGIDVAVVTCSFRRGVKGRWQRRGSVVRGDVSCLERA